jgi:hypothetical protein
MRCTRRMTPRFTGLSSLIKSTASNFSSTRCVVTCHHSFVACRGHPDPLLCMCACAHGERERLMDR